jgi:class 3 adenylate cyclase
MSRAIPRLMERDEEGTLTALKDLRREVAELLIGANSGRIVKTTGDGMLQVKGFGSSLVSRKKR